jgi:hypothetical protein
MGNDSGAAGAADVTGGTVLSLTSASLAVSLDVSLEVSLGASAFTPGALKMLALVLLVASTPTIACAICSVFLSY